jgi:metallo-beta-lactamase class B
LNQEERLQNAAFPSRNVRGSRPRLQKLLLLLTTLSACAIAFAQTERVLTTDDLFRRNVGTTEQQGKPFPPHKIIGNLFYIGTESLSSFLVTTPAGHILIDTTYERNNAGLQDSVKKLGFKWTDIKIVLGSHAHGDHQEGDALVKEQTGAQIMAMAEDLPALQNIRRGKPYPVDRTLHDGDRVELGGMTLVARLTPGHTRGCTTWTMKVQEEGKTYDVVIIGSMGVNAGTNLASNAALVAEYEQGFKVLHELRSDVPLGSHPAMHNMAEKYAKLTAGKGPNPYIDPEGYKAEVRIEETAYRMRLEEQRKAPQTGR